jgi:hypothetical protein
MFSSLRYLKSAGRLVWHEVRHEKSGCSGLLRQAVEWRSVRVDPETMLSYLRATSGEALTPSSSGEPLLPPLFPSVWETGLFLELLTRPGAPSLIGGVIHLESDFVQIRSARASDSFVCRLEVEGVERVASGEKIRVVTRSWSAGGQLCTESRSDFLVRDRKREGRGSAPSRVEPRPVAAPESGYRELGRLTLRRNHGRRYARASGDYNPIHLSRLTAAAFGLKRPILHGFCVAAIVTHEVLVEFSGGKPGAFRRIRVSFRRGVPLPSAPRLMIRDSHDCTGFRLICEHDRVYAEGDLVAMR